MQRPLPGINYLYNRTMDTRRFYRHTLKRDANGRERMWHFWARKSAAALFLSVMAGGACMIPAALVLLFVIDQFGSFDWEVYVPRAAWGAFSVGFFIPLIREPPHRPQLWD
jgi:hypothetical protein